MSCVYPNVTGTLCAMMSRGLTGQDAANNMIIVCDSLPNSKLEDTMRGGGSEHIDGQRL